jgi:outer membrane lipoprotein-sorting protein
MAKRSRILSRTIIFLSIIAPSIGHSYILPSTQIIQFMAKKYASVKTLQITQLTQTLHLDNAKEVVFGELISLMAPDHYRSEVAGQPEKRIIVHNGGRTIRIIEGEVDYRKEKRAFLFYFLLLAQDKRHVLKKLEQLDINLDAVSLTRFEGRIAYLIGNKEDGSPQLLVDKDLFVPLMLRYGGVDAFASDFTELKPRLWYPRSILFSYTGTHIEDYFQEEYRIKNIVINPSINASLFDISGTISRFRKSR